MTILSPHPTQSYSFKKLHNLQGHVNQIFPKINKSIKWKHF